MAVAEDLAGIDDLEELYRLDASESEPEPEPEEEDEEDDGKEKVHPEGMPNE